MLTFPIRRAGFSLLELLVVLAIFGLVSALALPNLAALAASMQAAQARDDIVDQLGRLSYAAFRAGKGFELAQVPPAAPEMPLNLPAGWQIRADPPIRFAANGSCNGGVVSLFNAERNYTVRLQPPFCQPLAP
jgi:prepilin-type N-terminal cleavage/methylation domain-containing protein